MNRMSETVVLEDELIVEYMAALKGEADEKLIELEIDAVLSKESALVEVILGRLEEAGTVTEHELCPHEDLTGKRRCRVVAYSFPDDSSRLELFTGYVGTSDRPTVLPSSEVGRLTGWAARFFEHAAKGDFVRFEQSPAALSAARHIHEHYSRIDDVRVHLLTDIPVRDRNVQSVEIQGRPIDFEVWDPERLYRAAGEEVTRDRIEVDFTALIGRPIACLEMKPPPKEYQTFLLVLPGSLVFQLYERYGARLFEFNVRSFLQAKGAVNKGIRRTISEQPGRFLAYNNGLTATADEINVGGWHGETVIHSLRGLQIVNGAQTTASIHRAGKEDKVKLGDVAVSMKLTLVPAHKLEEFVPKIAQFANTQNPIQVADLSASDRFHQQFEDLSEKIWCPGEETRWFYERARGAYQVARNHRGTTRGKRDEFDTTFPKSQHFGKTDLAKFLMTWWQEPHVVSKGGQKNYANFMYGLRDRFGENWAPDRQFYVETIAKAILFKATQALVRKAKLQSYGANVVTYSVARLAHEYGHKTDLEFLWEEQAVSSELAGLLSEWIPLVHAELIKSAGTRNVTEWCKKDGCWDAIAGLTLPGPTKSMPPEVHDDEAPEGEKQHAQVTGDADSRTTSVDPVKTCMELNGAHWAKIMAWAAASSAVTDFDRQVAHTISGYAMGSWKRPPTFKQAIRGVRVISAAKHAGVLDTQLD